MLKSAIAALGFVTHAMDLTYSSKMDLATSFGFILALAAETCLLVNSGISRHDSSIIDSLHKLR